MDKTLNWNSHQLTHGWQRGLRAFYWGLGFSEADFDKAQIGIGVPLLDGNLCNVHAYALAKVIQEGCEAEGMKAFPFGVPAVSDNITQGMEGGNASLPSRNMIANGAECVITAHCYDALIGLHQCDKNGPGFAMTLARTNYPGLIVSGGSILPGCHNGRDITILDPYAAMASVAVGDMDLDEADQIIRKACPGPGGCGIAASFNTWGVCMEAIGLMLPSSSSHPAISDEKQSECKAIGIAVRQLLEKGIRPRDILTRQAFENATVTLAAMGGSTNGILHLLALAQEAEIEYTLADIQQVLRRTPLVCNFAPRGTGTMVDLHHLGGTPLLLKHLLKAGLLDGDCLTVTGQTLAENLAPIGNVPSDQTLITPVDAPLKTYADIQICFGNLAPDGMVFKVSGNCDAAFRGQALCFEDARAIQDAVADGRIVPGTVCVLRYLGPVASGMPEVLVASAALAIPKLKGKVALISDTRVSGVSHGVIGVHCSPEAAVGGCIALVQDGDSIHFDLIEGTVTLEVDDQVLRERLTHWKRNPRPSKIARTYLADFSATCSQAHHGCVSKHRLKNESRSPNE